MQESNDSIIPKNNVGPTIPTNIERISIYDINIPVPTCIEQILPNMMCIYDRAQLCTQCAIMSFF